MPLSYVTRLTFDDFNCLFLSEIAKKVPKLPPNHPLACLESQINNQDCWETEDSSSDDDDEVDTDFEKTPKTGRKNSNISESINASRVLVEGNISRKKGHVIIPLRCSSEATLGVSCDESHNHQNLKPESPHHASNHRHNDLENGFFQQLAIIQVNEQNIMSGNAVEAQVIDNAPDSGSRYMRSWMVIVDAKIFQINISKFIRKTAY